VPAFGRSPPPPAQRDTAAAAVTALGVPFSAARTSTWAVATAAARARRHPQRGARRSRVWLLPRDARRRGARLVSSARCAAGRRLCFLFALLGGFLRACRAACRSRHDQGWPGTRTTSRRWTRQPQQNAVLFGRLLPNRRPTNAILFHCCSGARFWISSLCQKWAEQPWHTSLLAILRCVHEIALVRCNKVKSPRGPMPCFSTAYDWLNWPVPSVATGAAPSRCVERSTSTLLRATNTTLNVTTKSTVDTDMSTVPRGGNTVPKRSSKAHTEHSRKSVHV